MDGLPSHRFFSQLSEKELIGDYTLLKLMGYGSLGPVFLSCHRFLQKQFILKIIDPALSTQPKFLEALKKYTEQMSQLEHPHILPLQNVSESAGLYFVTYPVLEESFCSLHHYLEQVNTSFSEKQIHQIALQISKALDYAHLQKNGLAHLSLKPSNVLISFENENISVKITDFALSQAVGPFYLHYLYENIAKLFASETPEDAKRYESFLSHYLFLSPEQRRKKEGSSPHKSDVYAFGALLYLMLTGKHPEGFFEPVETLCPASMLSWDDVIQRCLAVDVDQRPVELTPLIEQLRLKNCDQDNALKPLLKPMEIQKPEYDPDPGAIFHAEKLVMRYSPDTQKKQPVEPLLTPMIVVASGQYERGGMRGARDEVPRHFINLNAYAIDIHPVTNEQFIRFLEEMGGEKDHHNNDMIRLRESRIKKSSGVLIIESGYTKHPVVGVSWYGAVAYAKWVGKRLPTEAEWEIAACGGLMNPVYPTDLDIDRTQANFFSSDTTAVMSYPPNGYGLYDIAGNVYEWCQDWYDYHYYNTSCQEPNNPKGPVQGVYRILRGGCWKSLKEDLRCSHRHRNNPGTVNGTYGFRLAADVTM